MVHLFASALVWGNRGGQGSLFVPRRIFRESLEGEPDMTQVAIVGGGAAGLGAALVLAEAGVSVTLIEQEAALGGHCFGVDVPLADGGRFRIDAGVSDFNMTSFTAVRRPPRGCGTAGGLADAQPPAHAKRGAALRLVVALV
jgi:phytoene dehydrogenase-like protein